MDAQIINAEVRPPISCHVSTKNTFGHISQAVMFARLFIKSLTFSRPGSVTNGTTGQENGCSFLWRFISFSLCPSQQFFSHVGTGLCVEPEL